MLRLLASASHDTPEPKEERGENTVEFFIALESLWSANTDWPGRLGRLWGVTSHRI